MQFPPNLIEAITDYRFFLEKGYPDKRTLALVADRYRLDRHQRGVLFRGIFRKEEADKRRRKIKFLLDREPAELHIDLLNQLYTVNRYLEGGLVFIAMDGMLRDAAEKHGDPVPALHRDRTIHLFLKFLKNRPDLRVIFYLDKKPDISQILKIRMEESIALEELRFLLISDENVDRILAEKKTGVLATSDSTIIDRTPLGVFDLAWWILKVNFDPKIPALDLLQP